MTPIAVVVGLAKRRYLYPVRVGEPEEAQSDYDLRVH